MKSKKIWFYVSVLFAFVFTFGCNKEEMQNRTAGNTLKIYNIINSGCLYNTKGGEDIRTYPLYETLHLKAMEDGRLQIAHDSVTFNCAAKIEIHVTQVGNQISVTEKDVSNKSERCSCQYNLKYEIPLNYGIYMIKINESKVYTFTYNVTTDTMIVLEDSTKLL